MEFLRIEKALNRLVGDSTTEGRFYQVASQFEQIFKDNKLTPEEKASRIAKIIESGIRQ